MQSDLGMNIRNKLFVSAPCLVLLYFACPFVFLVPLWKLGSPQPLTRLVYLPAGSLAEIWPLYRDYLSIQFRYVPA
jgi:hypothetical protein